MRSRERKAPHKSKKDNLFDNENELSFYIHIPFCDKLCSFCEYIKFKKDKTYEQKYIDILENDINIFLEKHSELTLYGFDIGGGTPTVLEIENFKKLMDISKKINNIKSKVEDYEPSIEATFSTLTEQKVKLISDAGFKRISLGIQTTNTKILNSQNRNAITLSKMVEVFDIIRKNVMSSAIYWLIFLENQSQVRIKSYSKRHLKLQKNY